MARAEDDLQKRVEKQREARRKLLHWRYHMAKELGFTSEEAAILQHWSEKRIRAEAYERGLIKL